LDALSLHAAPAISLASFKGKPVMLNVWNSSCVPCEQEAPLLQSQWQRIKSHGIVFIGIDFQDAKSDGVGFLEKFGITYLNVLDATGSTAISYGVTGAPETIFINRRGVVVSRVIGELTGQTLQSNLQLISR
jgi:cytochrome c biogenesis protein CcmG/thiol:disulfide interchange protein DsbE